MNDVEVSLLKQWWKQRKLVLIWRAIARRHLSQIVRTASAGAWLQDDHSSYTYQWSHDGESDP